MCTYYNLHTLDRCKGKGGTVCGATCWRQLLMTLQENTFCHFISWSKRKSCHVLHIWKDLSESPHFMHMWTLSLPLIPDPFLVNQIMTTLHLNTDLFQVKNNILQLSTRVRVDLIKSHSSTVTQIKQWTEEILYKLYTHTHVWNQIWS